MNPAQKDQAYDIRPGQSVELLKELHILTREGKLNQDSRRKLKQIYHLVQFIAPLINTDDSVPVSIVDHGAGKSYLGFILWDLVVKPRKAQGQIHSIERRTELVQRSQQLASRLEFTGMQFHHLDVAAAIDAPQLPTQPDLVTALHACNTATDEAIDYALARQADNIVLVPCCQAEVAATLKRHKAQALADAELGALAELWRQPIHTREFGSHLTNVLRCLRLQAHGYQVTVTELVGWEHSLKNELIVARRQPDQARERAARRLQQLLQQFGLQELSTRFALPQAS